jgi:hypothetical protein
MKTISNILILGLVLFVIAYLGQTIKAQRVKDVKLNIQLREGKISQEEYKQFKRENSCFRTIFNPKEVLSVD